MGDVLASVEAWADIQPDKPLYVFLDAQGKTIDSLTYAAFLRRVAVIAGHIGGDTRFGTGDRLLLAYPPGLEMICAFFACAQAGFIPVPTPAPTGAASAAALFRMEHVARDCGAAGVLTDAGVILQAAELQAEHPALASLPWTVTADLCEPPSRPHDSRTSQTLFLQYTSGSTSDPKGVIVSHDNVLANSVLVLDHGVPTTVSWLPQHHDMGLIGFYLNTAIGGGTLYGFSPSTFIQRPALWLETISRYGATASSAPNFAFEHCLRPGRISAATLETLDLGSLRMLMAAAEPIKPDVFRSFLKTFQPYGLRPESFVVGYGLAENTLAVSSYGGRALSVNKDALAQGRVRLTEHVADVAATLHILSCGRPLGDVELAIVEPETARRVADGAVGEVWVAGKSKCEGYWNRPESAREVFGAEIAGDSPSRSGSGYLRTGDMGFVHQGELYVCGRRKDMLIVRGQNFYPQDVERIVEQSIGVRRSGVAAVSASSGEVVVLAEAASPRARPDLETIVRQVQSRLNLEVARVVLVAPKSLPKTSSGKLMRQRSRELWEVGAFKVMGEFARERASDDDAMSLAEEEPFGFFRVKYRLTGEEHASLTEAGLDSLDLVLLMHEFSELLIKGGASDLADEIDIRLMQQMRIVDLFRLANRFEAAPETAIAQVRLALSTLEQTGRSEDDAMMSADRHLAFDPPAPTAATTVTAPQVILLTGATGFLGPFLLSSLLEQTHAKIYALVRGTDAEHAAKRLRVAVAETSKRDAGFWRAFDRRVVAVRGDLDEPGLGLSPDVWEQLAEEVDTVYHNGAMVNYLFNYKRMRAANVVGTNTLLKLAFDGRPKVFNYVSTTFIFGWATKDVLYETDSNSEMALLDFGYSQSKWTAEQVVLDAGRRGLTIRIFRPALVTPAVNGDGANFDITLRLLAFMIKYGVGVDALNQVSFMPADVTADNIVAISNLAQSAQGIFHVTRDDYANMIDVTRIITEKTGRQFEPFDLPSFVPEVIRRCTREDYLFPLLDFLVGSVDNISSMEFKRYDSADYQRARAQTPWGRPDPSLEDTVGGMLRFMIRTGMVELPHEVLAEQDVA